ncbi:conserved Plasmodium protein, unknown function [Plasmodium knowlesi strain H]|uniref:Uncharacterized protein n=3 Tax=Plasmodium knowlesi TaxID=5850 RepID=A0A5K1VP28_PLAKH|nr:conserved Plasmodium protein, unknown function [Plasmodium knowlesi strain H]OTN63623.1 Uncharacterized protein PKNOH_S140263300 [Plasmodium knowlesi]CAA9991048.1 conserved Plasmodium protein, unknown function [Plasmodium knowlesi strain H]SBO20667.1 conserved Plasmodium protein, unknown function [Plasmodium knowlesi strain H]SBO21093.1 conserved Plasmodium protein, unknown function [Plasmodium knowlesi strain H]VVS80522.1 conserved Plasmodium protein, unknown function [Plasmodium knowlesi |eukprot:XP_002262330.1 hypothetical protein, conserved in Plasmodium species [Plasmodium knowlesi strain H]
MLRNNQRKLKKLIFFSFILISFLAQMNQCMVAKCHLPHVINISSKRGSETEISKLRSRGGKNGMTFSPQWQVQKGREKTKRVLTFVKTNYTVRSYGGRKNRRGKSPCEVPTRCSAGKVVSNSASDIHGGANPEGGAIITSSAEMMQHLTFNFEEECNEIMVRLGNFLQVSPHLLFKDACVNLNKLFTNLYTYDNENVPFATTQHTLNITDEVIRHNKFKIYCVLGLKVLRIFLIKYLRSLRLCIPVEVRKRYILDFLKIEYISKIYDQKYNLIKYSTFQKLSEKLKAKLIYFYLALKPQDVSNVLIKIFKAANYKDENELLYKYVYTSKFTSRGGKRFHRIISKEYLELYEKDKLVKRHRCEDDLLWVRFFSLLKLHNPEVVEEKKLLKQTYRLIFSKMGFSNDGLVRLFEQRGFRIFDALPMENQTGGPQSCDTTPSETSTVNTRTTREKVQIGGKRKAQLVSYLGNLRTFISNYIRRNNSIHHKFHVLKTNIDIPRDALHDGAVTPLTNVFHAAACNGPDGNDLSPSPPGDVELYCETVMNNMIDLVLDIMIEAAGFRDIATLFGIYNSLKGNKDFKLLNFRGKFSGNKA